MKTRGTTAPAGAFAVEMLENGACLIRFFANAHIITVAEGGGAERTEYEWDEYRLTRRYYGMISSDIEANYGAWLRQAKAEDEMRTAIDIYQLRADVDYMELMYASGVAVMAAESDPGALEKARRYYPERWGKDRLTMLVNVSKLTPEDYQAITGEAYTA